MNLQEYLSAKSSNKIKFAVEDQTELEAVDRQATPITNPGYSTATRKPFADDEEDYSSGADFWQSAKIENSEGSGSKVRKQLSLATTSSLTPSKKPSKFQQDAPSDNSVANLLRKIKVTTSIEANPCQNVKSDSLETLTEESSETSQPVPLFVNLLKKLNEQVNAHHSDLVSELKKGLMSIHLELAASKSEEIEIESSSIKEKNAKISIDIADIKELVTKVLSEMNTREQTSSTTALTNTQSAAHHPPATIDRPTKNLISSIQEKLILVSKTQDHEFANISQRYAQLEKRILKPNQTALEKYDTILSTLVAIESKVGKVERERLVEVEKLEKLIKIGNRQRERSISSDRSSEDLSQQNYNLLLQELKEMRLAWTADHDITKDRMSQFMNMFSILQSVHGTLLKKVEAQVKNQNAIEKRLDDIESRIKADRQEWLKQNTEVLSSVKAIHEAIVSYLPLNLESKIVSIDAALKRLQK